MSNPHTDAPRSSPPSRLLQTVHRLPQRLVDAVPVLQLRRQPPRRVHVPRPVERRLEKPVALLRAGRVAVEQPLERRLVVTGLLDRLAVRHDVHQEAGADQRGGCLVLLQGMPQQFQQVGRAKVRTLEGVVRPRDGRRLLVHVLLLVIGGRGRGAAVLAMATMVRRRVAAVVAAAVRVQRLHPCAVVGAQLPPVDAEPARQVEDAEGVVHFAVVRRFADVVASVRGRGREEASIGIIAKTVRAARCRNCRYPSFGRYKYSSAPGSIPEALLVHGAHHGCSIGVQGWKTEGV